MVSNCSHNSSHCRVYLFMPLAKITSSLLSLPTYMKKAKPSQLFLKYIFKIFVFFINFFNFLFHIPFEIFAFKLKLKIKNSCN